MGQVGLASSRATGTVDELDRLRVRTGKRQRQHLLPRRQQFGMGPPVRTGRKSVLLELLITSLKRVKAGRRRGEQAHGKLVVESSIVLNPSHFNTFLPLHGGPRILWDLLRSLRTPSRKAVAARSSRPSASPGRLRRYRD